MDLFQNHLADLEDAPRMLYRSSHIYFPLVSILNVVLGVYLTDGVHVVKPVVQTIVSGVVLLAPILLLAGFFLEPGMNDLIRPYTEPALYALFGTGVVLSILGMFGLRRR